MLMAVIRLMLLPNIDLSQRFCMLLNLFWFIGFMMLWNHFVKGSDVMNLVLVVGLCLPPCLMLLAVNVVGGFMVTTICDVGGFRVTTMPDGMALFEMQLR